MEAIIDNCNKNLIKIPKHALKSNCDDIIINVTKFSKTQTYVSVLVKVIIGQLELVEGHRLFEPVGTGSGAVRVDVEAAGHVRLGLSGDDPLGVVVLVAAVVQWHDVHEQDVLGVRVQPFHAHLEGREHASARKWEHESLR